MRAIFVFFMSLSIAFADKPNVLFIAVDDLRTELNCYGQETQVLTPNIDKLAAESVLFKRAYCNIPVCGASRSSLMTGILPTPKRYVSYQTTVDKDTPGAVTLPQLFKENGYTTLSRGKIFHSPRDSESRSWSEKAWRPQLGGLKWLLPETGKILSKKRQRGLIYEAPDVQDNAYGDGMTTEKVIEDLRNLKKSGKPFFLGYGLSKPHLPIYAPKKYWDMYESEDIKFATNQFRPKNAPTMLRGSGEFKNYYLGGMDPDSEKFHRIMKHGYLACVSYIDKLIGDVLNELKTLNLDKNTIIVFWGDHGFHLGEHNFWGKHNTMHKSTNVPLIVKVPGLEGSKSSSLVETIDIFPTLCELAGLLKPAQLQGKSFKGILENSESKTREYIYSRYGPGEVIVDKQFSFTRFKDQSFMLYDHSKDPKENTNVAANPEYAPVIMKMQKRLDEAMAKAKAAKW